MVKFIRYSSVRMHFRLVIPNCCPIGKWDIPEAFQTLAKLICLGSGLSHNCNSVKFTLASKKIQKLENVVQFWGKSRNFGQIENITCCQKLFQVDLVHISYWKMPPQEMSAGGKRLNQLFKTPNFPLTSHIWQICDTKANFGTMSGILRWFSSLWICLDPENNEDELEHVYHHHRHPHHHNILTSLGFAWTLQTMSTSSDLETP